MSLPLTLSVGRVRQQALSAPEINEALVEGMDDYVVLVPVQRCPSEMRRHLSEIRSASEAEVGYEEVSWG